MKHRSRRIWQPAFADHHCGPGKPPTTSTGGGATKTITDIWGKKQSNKTHPTTPLSSPLPLYPPTSLFPPPHIAKSPLGGCTSPSHPRHQLNFLVFERSCLNGFRLAERPICISTVPCLSSSRRCPSDPNIFLKES